ncbi:MAG: hypothetical protein CFE26_27920, partial [Verrucomicrobiales bacterium VVV1]
MRLTRFICTGLGLGWSALGAAEPAPLPAEKTTVVLVVGADGEATYQAEFAAQVPRWQKVIAQAGAKSVVIGSGEAPAEGTDAERLKAALAAEAKTGPGELWVVLIGHGTFDG